MTQMPPPPDSDRPGETAGPAPGSAASPAAPGPEGSTSKDPLRHSRTSGAWAGVFVATVLLVLLVIFIVQNTESARIEFLGFDGSAPLSAALLIATVVGMVIAGVVGMLRIHQLRRRVKHDRRS